MKTEWESFFFLRRLLLNKQSLSIVQCKRLEEEKRTHTVYTTFKLYFIHFISLSVIVLVFFPPHLHLADFQNNEKVFTVLCKLMKLHSGLHAAHILLFNCRPVVHCWWWCFVVLSPQSASRPFFKVIYISLLFTSMCFDFSAPTTIVAVVFCIKLSSKPAII